MAPTSTRQLRSTIKADTSTALRDLATRSASDSPFLRLAPEIRTQIYRLVLGGHTIWVNNNPYRFNQPFITSCTSECENPRLPATGIQAHEGYLHMYPHGKCPAASPSALSLHLLQACRQVYLEAADMPFTDNMFGCQCPRTLLEFLDKLNTRQRRAIASLQLEWAPNMRMPPRFRNHISTLTGLHDFRLSLRGTWYDFLYRMRYFHFPGPQIHALDNGLGAFVKLSLEDVQVSVVIENCGGGGATQEALSQAQPYFQDEISRVLGVSDDA